MPTARHLARAVALVLALSGVGPAAQTTVQTTVSHVVNTATLSFAGDTGRTSVASNTVSLDVAHAKIPTTLSFRLLPSDFVFAGLDCQTSPELTGTGAPIDAAAAPPPHRSRRSIRASRWRWC